MSSPIESFKSRFFHSNNNEMEETIKVLFRPPEEDYNYEFPENLASRIELDKFKPNPEWANESLEKGLNRSLWTSHGDGHIARAIIYGGLLLEKMRKNGKIRLSGEQEAAIMLSITTHDLRYKSDKFESVIPGRMDGHQLRASDKQWLKGILSDFGQKGVSYFSGVSPDTVLRLASQINRVHDCEDDHTSLTTLKKDFPQSDIEKLPLELEIFKDIDAGLERLRTEELFKKIVNRALLTRPFKKLILNAPIVEKSLHRFHFPHFEETRELLPFAFHLYDVSIKNPEYKKDQWKTTMDTAQMLGALVK